MWLCQLHAAFIQRWSYNTSNLIIQIEINADLAVSKVMIMPTGHHLCYSQPQPQDIAVNMTLLASDTPSKKHA